MRFILIGLLFISACSQNNSLAKNKSNCDDVRLQVLGSGGPEIDDGLASSSYLIWINNKARIMVDAGGGSSLNFERSGANFNDLAAILLTHLHVDHSAALPVYIKAGYFTNREKILPIFGPIAGGDFLSTEDFSKALFSDQQKSAYAYLSDNIRQQSTTDFLINAQSVNPKGIVWNQEVSKGLSISAINVVHGAIPAIAWKINYQKCSVTFSGDMNGESGNLPLLANQTDMLVANNAIPQNAHRIAKNLHMEPSVIGEIASKSKAKSLLLSHFMNRTKSKKSETLTIIKKSYTGKVRLAEDLIKIELN